MATATAVVTENSVRSENTGVPIIREMMVATTISSLFRRPFSLWSRPAFRPVMPCRGISSR
jgi:hypothetical protein